MKKVALILMSLVLLAPVSAAELTVAEWNQLNADLTAYLTDYAERVSRGEVPPMKSGTPTVLYLNSMRPAGATGPMSLFERHDTLSFTYGTDHFLLHYTNNGAHAVYQYNQQTLEPGTPDYIVRASQSLEFIYAHMTGDTLSGHLGFEPALSDGYYTGGGNGGDGRYDLYFVNLPYYGATVTDSTQVTIPLTATAYMLMENDFAGFTGYDGDRNILALNVTAAHEFFHGVQFAIDVTEYEGSGISLSAAWIEMSAVFMEEEFFADVNDYYGYLLYYYAVPQWSLRTGYQSPQTNLQNWMNLHMYGAAVWPIFLKTHFGANIVRDIWDFCGDEPGPNWVTATNQAIMAASADSLNLREMYRRFALWNLFTGSWARSGSFFDEASHYPRITLAAQASSYPAVISAQGTTSPGGDAIFVPDSARPDNLGANYILLNNTAGQSGGLAVSFSPDPTQPWAVTVVGLPGDVSNTAQPIYIDPNVYDSSNRSILIPYAGNYNKVVLILAVTGGNQSKVDYALNITPLNEGVFKPDADEVIYAGTDYTITWFFADSVTDVLIELSIDNGQNYDTIAVTENDYIYEWEVPNTPSDSCLVRISNADLPSQYDISDGVFIIRAVGASRVLDPYPNPAWMQNIDFVTFKAEQATGSAGEAMTMAVAIFNLAGEKVRDFEPVAVTAGAAVVQWDFTNEDGKIVAAGPYLAVIEFGGQVEVKKFVVLR